MAEPHWTSYVGMVTGIIGTLSGIAASVLSVVTYRRASALKEMELRLELQKAASKADADLASLADLLPLANRSRRHVSSAKGMLGSGLTITWDEEYRLDESALKNLLDSAPKPGNFAGLGLKELEAKLVDLHKRQPQIQHLTDKYKAALAADDKDRERLQNSHGRQPRG